MNMLEDLMHQSGCTDSNVRAAPNSVCNIFSGKGVVVTSHGMRGSTKKIRRRDIHFDKSIKGSYKDLWHWVR